MPEPTIIVPIYVTEKDDPVRLVGAIEALAPLGKVYVVNQNTRVAFPSERDGRITVNYTKEALGIWGALHAAYRDFEKNGFRDFSGSVALNLAPLLFSPSDVSAVLKAVTRDDVHAIGARDDIAATLAEDPLIGKSRALMECFFTALAGVQLEKFHRGPFKQGRFYTPDGFTGLHAFLLPRYLESTWGWIERQSGKQPWGGALVSQIQTFYLGVQVQAVPIKNTRPRTWASTLGTDMKAVANMLDKIRLLPIFDGTRARDVEDALDRFPEWFCDQPWLTRGTAAEEARTLLDEYNRTAKEPLLDFAA